MRDNSAAQAKLFLVMAVCFAAAAASNADWRRLKRQPYGGGFESDETQLDEEASNDGGPQNHGGGHGKYFQYAHNPHHDHYDFGYKRGNHHHHIERYEKAHPHAGHFKTKVLWGDKHGGHGEHYWDYNHKGHDEKGGDGDGQGSENSPAYASYQDSFETRKK